MSLNFILKLSNGITAPLAACLTLRYEPPSDELYQKDYAKIILLGAAGVGFWAGLNLAKITQEYFKKRIEHTNKTHGQTTFFTSDLRNDISLCISLGAAALFTILNLPRFNQIFERYAPYYTSVFIRGMGFGYMAKHTVHALDALFHPDVT